MSYPLIVFVTVSHARFALLIYSKIFGSASRVWAVGCINTRSPAFKFLVARLYTVSAFLSRQSIVSVVHIITLYPSVFATLKRESDKSPDGGANSFTAEPV